MKNDEFMAAYERAENAEILHAIDWDKLKQGAANVASKVGTTAQNAFDKYYAWQRTKQGRRVRRTAIGIGLAARLGKQLNYRHQERMEAYRNGVQPAASYQSGRNGNGDRYRRY